MIWWSGLSAYSRFREVILWESLPTQQYRSERGGLALLLICNFHFFLPVTSVFRDLRLCCSDDLGCFVFMLAHIVTLAQFYQVCSLEGLQTALCSCCNPLQWDFSLENVRVWQDFLKLFYFCIRYWILIFPLPLVLGGFLPQTCACKPYPS